MPSKGQLGVLLLAPVLLLSCGESTTIRIEGQVRSVEGDSALYPAQVVVVEADTGVLTDTAGRFRLTVPASGDSLTVSIRHVGYGRWQRTLVAAPGKLKLGTIQLTELTIDFSHDTFFREDVRRQTAAADEPRTGVQARVETNEDTAIRRWLVGRPVDPSDTASRPEPAPEPELSPRIRTLLDAGYDTISRECRSRSPCLDMTAHGPVMRLPPSMRAALEDTVAGFKPWPRAVYGDEVLERWATPPEDMALFGAVGDFDGDGREDAALEGHDGRRQWLLVILDRRPEPRVVVIDSRVPPRVADGQRRTILSVHSAGKVSLPESLREEEPLVLENEGFVRSFLGEAAVLYYWDGDGFAHRIVGD